MAIFDTGAGGKQNLKFITAGAEQILEGYVGADAKGKPIEGTLIPKNVQILTITPELYTQSAMSGFSINATFDFVPDFINICGMATVAGSYSYTYQFTIYGGLVYGRFAVSQNGGTTTQANSQFIINDTIYSDKTSAAPQECNITSENLFMAFGRTAIFNQVAVKFETPATIVAAKF